MWIKWYSLFSHTGSETWNILRALNRSGSNVQLELAITDNMEYDGPLASRAKVLKIPKKASIHEWLLEPGSIEPYSVITLNGYMGILPEEVISYLVDTLHCRILNVHPAAIDLYPELRGADPQARTWDGIKCGKYSKIGVVIHDVDAGVDTGAPVLVWSTSASDVHSFSQLDEILRELSLRMWLGVFSLLEVSWTKS